MTLLGRLASLFPLAHGALILYTLAMLLKYRDPVLIAALLFVVYLLPPLLFRLYSLFYPASSGRWILNRPQRCDWWIAHQLQLVYVAFPGLEAVLRLVPGAYSFWLRLWGSKVGRRVYWTPLVEIFDRHMMHIGDDVVFGHRVTCASHIIRKKSDGDLVLVLRPIHIGSCTLVGAGSRIGPGVEIPENTVVPYNAEFRFRYAQ